jgi:hypothetical protein
VPFTIRTNTVLPVVIPDATEQSAGIMSAADKIKLDAFTPGGGVFIAFEHVIAQPADGSSFVVILPSPRPNANYFVTATLANASVDVIIKIPKASRTTTQFVCVTSFDLGNNDSINFIVGE